MNANTKRTVMMYDRIASLYDKSHEDFRFWLREQKFFQKLIIGKRILDIGCGTGRDGIFFVKNGFNYVGIDASRNMLKIARTKIEHGKFFQMDFYKLRFPENSFDGFWAAASLHLIPKKDVGVVLTSIGRIINPKGIGFISVKKRRKIREKSRSSSWFPGITRSYRYYSEKEFQKTLEKSGFQIIKVYYKNGGNWLCYFIRKI